MQISGNWIVCPLTGGNVPTSVAGQSVTVKCPKVGFFCSTTSSALNFTWDPTGNVPIPNAPPVERNPPTFPDIPFPPAFAFWRSGAAGGIYFLSNYLLITIGVLFVYFSTKSR